MGFQLNIVKDDTYTYTLSGGSVLVYSGGELTTSSYSVQSGALVVAGGSTSTADMKLYNSGGLLLSTSLPSDPSAAYVDFINNKKQAMISGGTAILNGNSQTFSGGYLGAVSANYLMSLNGIRGYADSSGHSCNININPSIGFWSEQVTISSGASIAPGTVLRITQPCVTCDDYNKLFAAEMIMYHAINKVAWNILNTGIYYTGSGASITVHSDGPWGTWYRYEGLVAYWDYLVYKDSFLNYNCSVRELLAVNLGWANPTCTQQGFICTAVVSRTATQNSSTDYMPNRVIFYPGTLLADGGGRDNNSYIAGDPIPFIIAYNSANVTSGAKIYCGPGSGTALSSLYTLASGCTVTIGGSQYSLPSIITGAQLTDVQGFTARDSRGGWVLGLAGSLGGQQYAAIGYTLSPAAGGSVTYMYNDTALDTYSVQNQWWVRPVSGGVLKGPYEKLDKVSSFNTYSIQRSYNDSE